MKSFTAEQSQKFFELGFEIRTEVITKTQGTINDLVNYDETTVGEKTFKIYSIYARGHVVVPAIETTDELFTVINQIVGDLD